MPEFAKINWILNMLQVLNIPKFQMWESSEYDTILNIRALHSILNMPQYTFFISNQFISN